MLDRDFLWCGLQMLIDEEEALGRLCPTCRTQAEEKRCVSCGAKQDGVSCGYNENFDLDLFYQSWKATGETGEGAELC